MFLAWARTRRTQIFSSIGHPVRRHLSNVGGTLCINLEPLHLPRVRDFIPSYSEQIFCMLLGRLIMVRSSSKSGRTHFSWLVSGYALDISYISIISYRIKWTKSRSSRKFNQPYRENYWMQAAEIWQSPPDPHENREHEQIFWKVETFARATSHGTVQQADFMLNACWTNAGRHRDQL
jgi:hypothetical protein